MLKDSILWFILSAFVIMFNLNKAAKEKNYFRDLVIQNFKFVVVLEFIVNIYNFNLAIELIIMPIIIIFAMLQGYSEAKEGYHKVGRVFGGILMLFGLTLLLLSILEIIKSINIYASFGTLKSFLLPIILTIAFAPFAYFLALFMNYETLFVRLKFILRDNSNFRYAKRRVVLHSFLSLARISKISDKINELYDKSTKSDIKKLIG